MKKQLSLLITISILTTALIACGGKKSGDKKGGKSAAPAKITLENVKDAKMGYSIDIPKGSKTLAKGDMGHTYSKVLPDGMFEYNTHISPMGYASLAQLVRSATMMGGKKIEQKKVIDGGFLVVKAPRGALQTVWFSKKGKTAKITVKCSGPKKGKDLLIKICSSLKVTK